MAGDIQMLTYSMAFVALLLKADRAQQHWTKIPIFVEHLATNFKTNIRELEGAESTAAYAEMQNFTPDLAAAKEFGGSSQTQWAATYNHQCSNTAIPWEVDNW